MSPVRTGGRASAHMLTHSICSDCSDNLDFQLGVSLETYLDSFKIPVVALDGTGFLIGVNKAAAEVYNGKADIDPVKWQEKVFECAHARLPQGCRQEIHCSGCAIRITANDSYTTGKSSRTVPAHFKHCSSDSTEKAELQISADISDNIVFLRIVRL
jgi:ferredoxin